MMKTNQWLYFGCHRDPGHYLFSEGMRSASYDLSRLSGFDGVLPPQGDTTAYIATVTRLEGWGLSALAFWDYSVDKRGGSNSVVFAPSIDIAPADLLAGAMQRFPQVFERLPQPVQLLSALRAAGLNPSPLGD